MVYSSPWSSLQWLAGALCCSVTSESVCMLREMVVREVGHLWLLYPGILVVVVETEVPTTCSKVFCVLICCTIWKACFACGAIGDCVWK